MNKTPRQQQKEKTRQRLLDVAISEFGRQGIMNTRMSDIARAAGVSHGTVFSHFASQEYLITAVIEDFGARMARRTHELAYGRVAIREILAAHLASILEFEEFYTRLVIESRILPRAARETFIVIQSAVSFHISQSAQSEMDGGSMVRMPVHLLFNTWVGLLHYYLSNGDLFAPQDSVLNRYGSILIDHFMGLVSISGRKGESK